MTDPKSKGIPAWQRTDATDSSESSSETSTSPELTVIEPRPIPEAPAPTEDDVTRAELITQATSWLDHQHIRDAPLEGKISFLEGKGLTTQEINEVLGLKDGNPTKTAPVEAPASNSTPLTTNFPDAAPSFDDYPPTSNYDRASISSDTPPIITYPEFLLKPAPKPPLVSRTALLRTAYATALAASTLHLSSKYLVEPMVGELGTARHEFFATASDHLDAFNDKLTSLVSVVPVEAQLAGQKAARAEHDEDTDSEASDPGELFHRDFGVQTSEPSSPVSSSAPDALSPVGKVEVHAAKMQAIRAHLGTLHDSATDAVEAMQGVDGEMAKLDLLLDDLKYARRTTMRKDYEATMPSGVTWGGNGTNAVKDKEEDAIDRLKAEIKGVKGVLLSARSFPSSNRPASAR